MSVLPNQTNATPGDAFFWRVDAEIITAKEFIAYSTIQTFALSTGSITVGNISTTGNLTVSGDVTALNVTATDSLTTYFANTQYVTSDQGANIKGLLLANQIQGSNLVQFPDAILSSITTTSIRLDGNTIDTAGAGVGAVLLLNGQPIATASTLTSSIQTWSYWPAISTVQMSGQNLLGASVVQGDTANFYDINATNQITFATNLYGQTANLSNVNTNLISSAALLASSIKTVNLSTVNLQATTIKNAGTLTSQQADITTVNATSITTDSLTTLTGGTVSGTNGSFQNLTVTNSANFSGTRPNFTTGINSSGPNNFNNQSIDNAPNINTQGNQSMTIASANGMDLTAPTRIQLLVDGGNDVGSFKPINLIAGNGNRGQVNITGNPGFPIPGLPQTFGEVNIVANGGGSLTTYATGGSLNLTANTGSSPILGTVSYSAIKLNAAGITSYAGFASPLIAVPGYNLIQGTLGIELIAGSVPGLPSIPGTIYLYGATGVAQTTGGVRCQNGLGIDFIVPYPQGFNTQPYDLIISGNPAGQKVTLSNVRILQSDGGTASGFASMSTSNVQASNIIMFGNGSNNGNILGLSGLEQLTNFSNISSLNVQGGLGNFITVVSQRASTQSLFISTINGLPFSAIVAPTIPSTFSDLTTNLLQANTISTNSLGAFTISNVSSINGFSISQLVSSVSPPIPAPSTFLDLYTSSFVANTIQTSNISTISLQAQGVTGVSTINGFTIAQFVSSVSPPTPAPSTFTQLFTSSLVADSITGASFSPGLKLLGNGVTIQPTLDNGITLTTTGVGQVTIVSQEEMQVFSPSTIVFGDFRATTINGLPPVTSIPTNYPQLTVSSLVGSNISTTILNAGQVLLNGVALGPQVSSFNTLEANQISSGSLQVSSIGGYSLNQIINQPIVSSFNNLTVSTINAYDGGILYQTGITLQVSSINGYNVQQFLSTPSPTIQVSTFNQLFTSSLLASGIVTSDLSTTTLKTSSINGYNIAQLANQPTVSTFQQLFTSSLQANQISTGVIVASNISTQNINAFTLDGVSSVNGFSIAQLVSSVSPQPPIPSTVTQFYTSSLAANGITNYQTGDLSVSAAAYMDLRAGVAVRIGADQCNVSITAPSLVENIAQFTTNNTGLDYAVTAGRNISINSSNTLSIYNTNTAPPVGSNDLYIIGQGVTTLAGQNTTNVTSIGALNLIGSPVNINGVPAGGATSTFTQINTNILSNNPAISNDLKIRAANAIVLNDLGETTISLGGSFEVRGATTGGTDINTNYFNSQNSFIALRSYNTFDLLSLSSLTVTGQSSINIASSNINLNSPSTICTGDIRAATFNGLPLPTGGGGGNVTSTFTQLNTNILSNNPAISNDLKIRATNAIVLNDTGETTVSIGGSLEVRSLATGAVDIQTDGFNSLNNFIALSAFNTLDLLSLSSLTVTGQSGINITSSNLNINTSNINITNPQQLIYASSLGLFTDAVGGFYSSFFVFNQSEYGSGLVLEKDTAQLYGISSVTLQSDVKVDVFSPSTIFQGDVRALTFNGLPLPTGGGGGGGSVTSTFSTVFTNVLSNNPAISNDLRIRAANAIVMDTPLGATSISLGDTLEIMGTTGATNIYSQALTSLNSIIAFSAYNTLDLASVSSLTVTGQSSINIASSNISLTAPRITAATAVIGEPSAFGSVCAYFGNSSRAANGSEYAILQENNGRTFLNAVTGTDLRFRVNNTDVMIMSNDGLYMSQKINMNGNNILAGSNQLLSIGTNTTASNVITFSNYGGSLGDIKMKSYNIDIGDSQNGTIAIKSGGGGYATIEAANIWLQGTVNMCNNNINNVGTISSLNVYAGTAVIGTPSAYGTNYAYFGNNSLAANGGEYALLQENNGRTFLNSKLYQPLNLRNGNYDIMILDDTKIDAFKPLNMNSNNISNVGQFITFQNGGYIQSQTNTFLDINGAGNGVGALRLLNYGGLFQISGNGEVFLQPASGQTVYVNGTMTFYQTSGTPLNMNGNSISNVSTISLLSNATIISPDTINLTAPSTFMTGSLYFNPASTSEIDLKDGYLRNASYITNPFTTNIQAFTGLYLTSAVRANITAPDVRIQGTVDHVNCNVNFISQLRSLSTLNNNIDALNLNIDAPSTIISGTVQRNLIGTNVTQPIIQYGTDGVSGGSGSVNITLDTPYSSSNSYVAFACMNDTDPAQMAVARVDSNVITISWQSAGGGSHTLAWQTLGT